MEHNHLQMLLVALLVVLVEGRSVVNSIEDFAVPSRLYSANFTELNKDTMEYLKSLIRWLIDSHTEDGRRTFNAGLIRLAFHDCMGGCDGCVNLSNPANRGLAFYKLPVDMMYHQYVYPRMSRADWYALAGSTAAEYASELSPTGDRLQLDFRWGRKTCHDEFNLLQDFPGIDIDGREVLRREFRLNLAEVVALQGAHTLGRDHSVRNGSWVTDEDALDNSYFKDMIDNNISWSAVIKDREPVSIVAFTHGATRKHHMFISDMFNAYNMEFLFHLPECITNPEESCPRSSTYGIVKWYAEDNGAWLTTFGRAFNIMMTNGYFGSLKSVTENEKAAFPHQGGIQTNSTADVQTHNTSRSPSSDSNSILVTTHINITHSSAVP